MRAWKEVVYGEIRSHLAKASKIYVSSKILKEKSFIGYVTINELTKFQKLTERGKFWRTNVRHYFSRSVFFFFCFI